MFRKLLYLFVLFFTVGAVTAYGQSATDAQVAKGRISGTVIEKATGQPLTGVAVQVEGTATGNTTDLDGRFSFVVPQGTYTVVVSFVGFSTLKFSGIAVASGKTTLINASMSESANELADVEVVSTLKKGSASLMLMELRNADAVGSGISSDVIKRTPDRTVADVLKRISGASIIDNKFAVVRGLSDRYNLGFINNSPLPSSESDRKAFSLELIPSSVIESVVITKTATPDMPGDFAGGFVQINTKDIPFENTNFLSLGTGMNTVTTFKPFSESPTQSNTDWLNVDHGARQFPAGAFSATQLQGTNDPVVLAQQARLFDNNFAPKTGNAVPNINFQAGSSRRFKVAGNEAGVIAALTYSRNLTTTLSENYSADLPNDTLNDRSINNFTSYRISTVSGGIVNLSYKVGANSKFSFKNLLTLNGDNTTTIRDRTSYRQSNTFNTRNKDYFYFYNTDLMYSSQFSGEHLLHKSGIRLNYTLGYLDMYRQIPDFKKLYYESNQLDGHPYQPYSAVLVYNQNGGNTNAGYSGRYSSELKEKSDAVNIALAIPVKSILGGLGISGTENMKSELKVGGLFQERNRTFFCRNLLYSKSPKSNYALVTPITQLGPGDIFLPENFGVKKLVQYENTSLQDSYDAASTLRSAFAMMENKLYKNSIRLLYGMRIEQFNQRLNTYSISTPVHINTVVTDWLPSANIIWAVNENSNLRVAASKTVSRPEFREFAPVAFYEVNFNVIQTGNPELTRTAINNYDLKYEYFPAEGAIFSVNPFAKTFDKPIEFFLDPGAGIPSLSYNNTKSAWCYGAEFEARYDLLENLTAFGNYTYIKSKINIETVPGSSTYYPDRPMQGQSPYLINLGVQYKAPKPGLDFQLTFNESGRRIAFVAKDPRQMIWINPRPVLDFSVSKAFNNGFIGKVTIGDLLARNLVYYRDLDLDGSYNSSVDIASFTYKMGRVINISLNYNF